MRPNRLQVSTAIDKSQSSSTLGWRSGNGTGDPTIKGAEHIEGKSDEEQGEVTRVEGLG